MRRTTIHMSAMRYSDKINKNCRKKKQIIINRNHKIFYRSIERKTFFLMPFYPRQKE